MSEVIFKNEFGEYKVGDAVYAVAQGYGHTPNIYAGTILGITENGRLQINVKHESYTWVEQSTGREYDWQTDGRIVWNKNMVDEMHTDCDQVFVKNHFTFEKKHTLYLNRVMPRPE